MAAPTSARPDDVLPNPENSPKHLRARTRSNARIRLLTLPAEIREKIWRSTLTSHEVTVHESFINFGGAQANRALALLKTCRQIYIEARLVFYSGNSFNLSYYTFFRRNWGGNRMFSREQLETVNSVILDRGRLYFWDGKLWTVPWMAYIKTFPNLKRVVLRGFDLKPSLERNAVAGESATWAEYADARKGDKLEIIIEDYPWPE